MITYLADANSHLDLEEMYPQHQAAITLMQESIDSPDVNEFKWLDLLCGQGQILAHFKEHFSAHNRSKITYYGYDINVEYVSIACSLAKTLDLKCVVDRTGHIKDLKNLCANLLFDFITITSGFHEVNPFYIPKIITECLSLLNENGKIYLYDVEKLVAPELGAFCLRKYEIEKIVTETIRGYGNNGFTTEIVKWPHKKSPSWSAILKRENIGPTVLDGKIQLKAIKKGEKAVGAILSERLSECTELLDAIAQGSFGTIADHNQKVELLFDFYSLTKYTGGN